MRLLALTALSLIGTLAAPVADNQANAPEARNDKIVVRHRTQSGPPAPEPTLPSLPTDEDHDYLNGNVTVPLYARQTVGRAGLAVNEHLNVNVGSFGGKLGWYYSWSFNARPGMTGLQFVPMVWGRNDAPAFSMDRIKGAKHVLGFNEPDISSAYGGSSMPVADAVRLHKQWANKVTGGVQIGSIACARGAANGYFKQWVDACAGGCKFDFIPFHFYGTNIEQLKVEIQAYKRYDKPLWLTEVACREYRTNAQGQSYRYDCTKLETDRLMRNMVKYFGMAEGNIVKRWAWFGSVKEMVNDVNGLIGGDGKANARGKWYASL